jgi:murein DD-endopeptidase MepM/ murein hydrolase activator NlpD
MSRRNFRIVAAVAAALFAVASASASVALPKPKYPVDAPGKRGHPAKLSSRNAPDKSPRSKGNAAKKDAPAKRDRDSGRDARGKAHDKAPAKGKADRKAPASKSGPKTGAGGYTVVRGDTLSSLARKFDVPQKTILEANDLDSGRGIRAGMKLRVPHGGRAAPEPEERPSRRGETSKGGAYVVARGDTVAGLAKRFGVSKQALMDANDLDSRHGLRKGMKLRLPRDGERAQEEPRAKPPSRKGEAPRGSGTYTVARGDTLSALADRFGVSQRELMDANNLDSRHGLRRGMKLHVPHEGDRAEEPRAKPPGRTGETPRGGETYTVARGDTVSGLARRFGVTSSNLREANHLDPRQGLRSGMKLRIPSDAGAPGGRQTKPSARPTTIIEAPETARDRPVDRPYEPTPAKRPTRKLDPGPFGQAPARPSQVEALPPPVAAPPRVVEPYVPPKPRATASSSGQGAYSDSQILDLGRGRFIWPVRGETVLRFGSMGRDQKNDGLNIAAAEGTGVRAAAAGEVVYSGSSIPGYGNLVLIKHADGWVTAYAHLSKLEVRMKQRVGQGEEIGQVGQSGGVDRPQLHFEVRYAPDPRVKARPVDPAALLP